MTMDDHAWTAFLDTLTERERYVVQGMMARTGYVLNTDRILEIEDFQHLEDKAMNQQRQIKADEVRQDDADARMDRDEEQARQQADATQEHFHEVEDRLTDLEHPHEAAG